MKKRKLAIQYAHIRGSIGKEMVVRHTPWGVIVQKYPDMKGIKPSKAQKSCRNSFRDAVAWAKQVIQDETLKKEWQKKLKRANGVYNAALSFYLAEGKKFIAKVEGLKLAKQQSLRKPCKAAKTRSVKIIKQNSKLINIQSSSINPITWQTTKTKPAGKTAYGS